MASSWIDTFQTLLGSRAHKPSFVVFDISQSGSHILFDWFQAHEAIAFQADILSRAVTLPRLSVYQRVRQSSKRVYGFHVSVEQLCRVQRLADPNQFLQDLHRGGCRVIYVNRRNALHHAIALLKAYSANYRFDRPASSPEEGKMIVDVSELLACLTYLDHRRIEAAAILREVPYLLLTYEDDLLNPTHHATTASRLTTFLDISSMTIPIASARISSLAPTHHRLVDIVANLNEVHDGLNASDYAYLLTDQRYLMTSGLDDLAR